MRNRPTFLYLMALCGLLLTAPGCPLLLIGAGVAGGYAISRDTAIASLERGFDAVWDVTKEELAHMATINEEDKVLGTLEAVTSDKTKLWVTISRMSDRGVELKIKARKNLMPRVKVAQKLMEHVLKRF